MGVNIKAGSTETPDLNTMLQKLAWMEAVIPTLDQNPATKRLTEKLVRSNVRKQYTGGGRQSPVDGQPTSDNQDDNNQQPVLVSDYRLPLEPNKIVVTKSN